MVDGDDPFPEGGGQAVEDGAGAVVGAVVDDHDRVRDARPHEGAEEVGDGLGEIGLLTEGRHDDGYAVSQRRCRWRRRRVRVRGDERQGLLLCLSDGFRTGSAVAEDQVVSGDEGEGGAGQDADGGRGHGIEDPDREREDAGVEAQAQAGGGLERRPPGRDRAARAERDAAVEPGEIGTEQEVQLCRGRESDGVGESGRDPGPFENGEDSGLQGETGRSHCGETGETQA
ncbi:hypothetical protein GCM10029992_64340 [Glycomyces albus]